jgi:osmotically-inducible protein OsmY
MTSTKWPASSIAAIAMIFVVAACTGDVDTTADTASGAVGNTTAATAATPNPSDIEDRVEVALSTDSTLRPFGLDADAEDNRIVLKGAVRTETQRSNANTVASAAATGLSVENRIRVDATARMSDNPVDLDEVEEQVQKAFADDTALNPLKLDVDEDNGQILLQGTVRTSDQKAAAERIAKRITGDVRVVNRITVGQ